MEIERISGVQPINTAGASYQNNVRPVENVKTDSNATEDFSLSEDQVRSAAEMLLDQQDEKVRESTDETIGQDLNDIKKKLGNTECKFGIDEATNRITIKIVDKDSKKIIKELPPEKTLKMIAKVWEMAGMLVDEKL